MPVLTPDQLVRSRRPTMTIENHFEPGAYRFRLVVIDDERNASAPAELVVRVGDPPLPDLPLRPDILVRPEIPVLSEGPRLTTPIPPTPSERLDVGPRSAPPTEPTGADPSPDGKPRRTRKKKT